MVDPKVFTDRKMEKPVITSSHGIISNVITIIVMGIRKTVNVTKEIEMVTMVTIVTTGIV